MFEKKYKQYVENNFAPRDDFEKLSKKLNLKEKHNMKKGMKYTVIGLTSACVVAGVAVGVTFGLKNKDTSVNKVVTLSLDNDNLQNLATNQKDNHTEIQLTVDENDKVVSVYGNDHLAKVVLVDQDLEGKDINEALKTIIDVEINTGIIIKGNVSANANSLSISVSAELSEETEKYLKEVKTEIEDYLKENNIKASVEEIQGMTLEAINKKVQEIDPSVDINELSYEEKLKIISIHYIEVSSLYSDALEDLYLDAKNYEIEFTEQQITKDIINGIDGLNEKAKAAYLKAYDAYAKATNEVINSINDVRYELVVNPDGEFQNAYQKLNDALNEVIIARNELANDSTIGDAILSAKILAYNVALESFNAANLVVNASCDAAIKVLNASKELMKAAQDILFVDDVKDTLTKELKENEQKLNEAKDKFFNDFESEHKDDINKMKQELIKQKEALINAIKKA